jgi:hypothetical protein
VAGPPLWLWGGFDCPKSASTANDLFLSSFFFFVVWALGVAKPLPMAMGWLRPPQIGQSGVAEAIPRPTVVVWPPLMGWPVTLGFLKIFFNLLLFLKYK